MRVNPIQLTSSAFFSFPSLVAPRAARAADPGRTLLLPNGGHFVGEFNKEFRPHGEGTEFRADGSEAASGQWRHGKMNGRGKGISPCGHRFDGELVDGKRSGLGIQWDTAGNVNKCGR